MLPSTGYFKGINCPFYDSGLCERPYCHFRHVKKDSHNTSKLNDGIESGAIMKLVSAAVQKVLQQSEASTTTSTRSAEVSDVSVSKLSDVQLPKVTYNPTPISELNKIKNVDSENNEENAEQRKKHIPVPYTPRKPTSLPIKRPVETNGSSKPFIFIPPPLKYTPGCSQTVQLDQYTPKGSTVSGDKYQPGSEIELQKYTPKETGSSNKRNYVPSERNSSKKKILEYKPAKVKAKSEIPQVTYQPTPRTLVPCFSSDEEEPEAKKSKLFSDLNGLDDLGPEFDILDQILDEEKPGAVIQVTKIKKDEIALSSDSQNSKIKSKINIDHNKKEKTHNKNETIKTQDKTKSDRKEKSSSQNKERRDSKITSSTATCHTSSSKSRSEKELKEKLAEKKKHSSSKSKSSEKSSKYSDSKSLKNSERHSKHSSSHKKMSNKQDKSSHHKTQKTSIKTKLNMKKQKEKPVCKDLPDNNSNHNAGSDYKGHELYDISESDEETRDLECKRIFEEYVHTEKNNKSKEKIGIISLDDPPDDSTYVSGKKRISRTTDKNIKVIQKPPIKPDFKLSAAQTMAERLGKVTQFHASRISGDTSNSDSAVSKTDQPKSTFTAPHVSNSKIRIACVPNASNMINAKRTLIPSLKLEKQVPSTSSTVVQTIKKGMQRVAHIPNDKFIDRPGVLEPLASKIPANIRSTYLNTMIDECLKIYLSPIDAYARAQHEELNTSKKCSTAQIYKNSAVLAVSRLRKELHECNGVKKSGSDCSMLQKIPQMMEGGKSMPGGSWSIENKNRRITDSSQEFSGGKLYNNIKKWILTEQQLKDNGYPRPHSSGQKGRAEVYGQNKHKPPKESIRLCCRCKKDYIIDKKGYAAVEEACIYHPNNKYRVRGEARYQCCYQDASSDGCCIARCHVYDYVDFENLKGYVKTLPPDTVMDDYGVYSLDCEMCYTTNGLELTRVTVIDSAGKVVYETLIKPLHPIIDYNTRYSGITEEQMAEVRTTLLEVQATLLTLFNSQTILIGHSLESDFKALKLIHDTVIDTSVLFPHKMGPPYKRALRNLSSELLKKIIQNSVDGHDSAEDAMVCMELIMYKLKEDLKTR